MKMLKALAVFSMFILPAPLLMTTDMMMFSTESGLALRYVCYAVFAALITLIGAVSALFFGKMSSKKKLLAARICSLLALALMTALVIIWECALEKSSLSLVIYPFFCPFYYLLGLNIVRKSFTDIFSAVWLGVFACSAVFSAFIYGGYLTDDPDLSELNTLAQNSISVIIGISIFIVLSAAVLLNQTNISVCSERRNDVKAVMPRGLRRYNIVLLSVVAALFALSFLLRNAISGGITALLRLIGRIAIAIISAIAGLEFTGGLEETETEDLTGELVQSNQASDVALLVFIIVVVTVLIACRRQILRGIRGMLAAIKSFLEKKEPAVLGKNDGYVDTFEELDNSKNRKKAAKKTLRAAYKAYAKEKRPVEKYRLGYRFFVIWLKEKGARISVSDTVRQHFEKAGDKLSAGGCSEIATQYNAVRYNDVAVTSQEISEMDCFVRTLYNGG